MFYCHSAVLTWYDFSTTLRPVLTLLVSSFMVLPKLHKDIFRIEFRMPICFWRYKLTLRLFYIVFFSKEIKNVSKLYPAQIFLVTA